MTSPALAWDSDAWRKLRNAKLLDWMAGNANAVATVLALSTIAETWDDLYDGDNPPDRARVNEAFTLALVELQANDFYMANMAIFYGLVVATINAWMDSNALAKSADRRDRMLAYHLRNFGHEITCVAAFRAGGWDHLRRVSLEIRAFFANDDFDLWDANHGPDRT